MRFSVSQFGPIEHAEVNLSKQLILFCGQNNTGKTYLMYLVYFFLVNLKNGRYGYNEFKKLNLENKSSDFDFEYHFNLLTKFGKNIMSNIHDELPVLLACGNEFEKTKIDFYLDSHDAKNVFKAKAYEQSEKLNLLIDKSTYTLSIKLEKNKGSHELKAELYKADNYNWDAMPSSYNYVTYVAVNRMLVKMLLGSKTILFPAERSAINIFSKELSLTKNQLFSQILNSSDNQDEELNLLRNRVNRYPKPIRDSLKIAEDLAVLQKQSSPFAYLADELESSILGGQVKIGEAGDLRFAPKEAPEELLETHMSSSLVKSLSPIAFYLRHQAEEGDCIMIDEPELNLHPDNQRKIARFFGTLINAGFRVMISTHSDYIVRELNNLIMLSKDSEKVAVLRERYGYKPEHIIQPEKIAAYLFRQGHPRPENIMIDETGLSVSTIDETISELNESSQDIYFTLFD